jgi:hypothetical protein
MSNATPGLVKRSRAAFVAALRNYYKLWADTFGAAELQMLQRSLGRNLV